MNLRNLQAITPSFLRGILKRVYRKVLGFYARHWHLRTAERVEFGYRFRFERTYPYGGTVGARTIVEDFNVWNADSGSIAVGSGCWFGLNNIVMGPIEIGDNTSTGPYVFIVGPRHAKLGYHRDSGRDKTVIGKNVWISTNSVVHFGVTIGDGAIIAPGSVVSKDVEAGGFVAGNPARVLTQLIPPSWKNGSPRPEGPFTNSHAESEERA